MTGELTGSAVVIVNWQRLLALRVVSARVNALRLVGMIMVIVLAVIVQMVAMQMPAIETMAVQIVSNKSMIVQQTAGRRGQQIRCDCNSRNKPTDEHGNASREQRTANLQL